MFKYLLYVIALGFTGCVLAQPFGFQSPSKADKSTIAPPVSRTVQVASPDDFKGKVQTLDKQNQDDLSKQLNDLLPKHPASGSSPSSSEMPPSMMQPTGSSQQNSPAPA